MEELAKGSRELWLKPAARFPDHTWVLSTKARQMNRKYNTQAQKQDQDKFRMYVYNDFTDYGLQEVIENQVSCTVRIWCDDE